MAATTDAWRRDMRVLGAIFALTTVSVAVALYVLVVSVLSDAEWDGLHLPTSLQAAQRLGDALQSFATKAPTRLLLAHMCCYLYLQTFAIPGTVFFNLLGGALFGITWGFPLCLLYNTLGSVFMFLLSRQFGRRVLLHYFPERLTQLKEMIDGHRDDLALYMVFLRVFPFTPNWFINMASPHLDIPVLQFSIGPAIGLIPYNFLSCKAGLILKELRSRGDIIDTTTTIQLIVVAIVGAILLPRLKQRFAAKATIKDTEEKKED
ncbi:hypothetical protein Poli38472_003116 [Pythium oligandrum]|uniref:VTT domain-containing protein n=1 Tax=Pythium oligandrum TaxID=41045 RepID=A0A8K1C688_PYTOL|nr:hypothetical protein Poli38472_003116 [Pythium oligandrum]|eukprot:TMW57191.1 hypothetical protein Poli38472_003116 [Pythium oligandrum]